MQSGREEKAEKRNAFNRRQARREKMSTERWIG